jgi:hypothetical protein
VKHLVAFLRNVFVESIYEEDGFVEAWQQPAFAVFTTVPWNHTTKRYQTDLLKRHDGTKPGPWYCRDSSDGTIEIEKLGVALIIEFL